MILVGAAIVMGLMLGLTGGGGAIISVPALIYAGKMEPKQAVATALGVVGFTALVAGMREWSLGTVRLKQTLPVLVFGIVGSFIGARFASQYLPDRLQMAMFSLVVLFAAWSMLRGALGTQSAEVSTKRNPYVLGAVGFGVGALSGMLGLGGGFMMVPALHLFGRLTLKQSVGTALVLTALNSFSGVVGYFKYVRFDPYVLAMFCVVGVISSQVGTAVRYRVSEKKLKIFFAIFLILMGVYLLYDRAIQ